MTYISLREVIDDVLLLVRNNNISESEDLSRAQIATWVKAYRASILKQRLDQEKNGTLNDEDVQDSVEGLFIREKGPLELEEVTSDSGKPTFTKRTKDALENVFDNDEDSILSICDEEGDVIQYMNHQRRHYNYFRKYTFGELTAYYKDDGHIYVEGTVDKGALKYIYVTAVFDTIDDDDTDDDTSEDDIKIPAWLVPPIKEQILKNELSFMVQRPSDDSNNATLASVKPRGPQDAEQ